MGWGVSTKRLVSRLYVCLFLYALIIASATTISLEELLPAFVQLALGYVVFALGYGSRDRMAYSWTARPVVLPGKSRPAPASIYLLTGLTTVLAALVAGYYYTGKLPLEVASFIADGRSLYWSYQVFNSDLRAAGGGRGFSPYFALLVYGKFVLVAAVFTAATRVGRMRRRELLLIILAVAAQAYLGLARGTGLEFFQLGTVLAFALLVRRRNVGRAPAGVIAVGLAVGLAALYAAILTARGATTSTLGLGNDVDWDPHDFARLLGPLLGALLRFYDYFGFGFHYVATYWSQVWFASPSTIMAGLLPGGYDALGIDPTFAIRSHLVMGGHWHPDSILVIARAGFIGLLAAFFLLGRVAGSLAGKTSMTSTALSYYVCLQMLSMPVGNFVWVDTTNIVVLFVLIAVEALRAVDLLPQDWSTFFSMSSARPSAHLPETRTLSRVTVDDRLERTSQGGCV